MAEVSYYDADLSDAVTKLNETMEKFNKAPAGVKPEVFQDFTFYRLLKQSKKRKNNSNLTTMYFGFHSSWPWQKKS